ncbi:MAG: hypothetical protein IJ512_07360 [Ruminococcus sp.]|nr:hypothetical protein [Ruminococcus sp.]
MENLRIYPYLRGLVLLLITGAVLLWSTAVYEGMRAAVQVCLETMIPSLYAMMICSELLLSRGTHRMLATPLHKPAKLLLGCSGQVLVIFLLSQAAGYPIGAKMLSNLSEKKQLSRKQASLLAGVCFGGGPAFLSALFAEHPGDGRAVFLAGLLANGILFCCMSRFLHTDPSPAHEKYPDAKGAGALVGAAASSGAALLKICAMVIFFGGGLALLSASGALTLPSQLLGRMLQIPENEAERILCAFAEISRITDLIPYRTAQLPLLGAMLSFGGICVLLQIAAVTEGRLHMGWILLLRCIAAALTGTFLFLRQLLIPTEAAAAAAVIWNPSAEIHTGSPLPALFLLVMTGMLLCSVRQK